MSRAVDSLVDEIGLAGLPAPVREHRFHPVRKWRFDIAWVDWKVAVEVDGGVFIQGGHTRGAAYEKDREKDAEAMLLGWTVLRVTPRHVRDGRAIRWIDGLLRMKGAEHDSSTPGDQKDDGRPKRLLRGLRGAGC